MQHDIIFSGFGGQGALFAGQLLAYAALDAGRNVTWIPSYGPMQRIPLTSRQQGYSLLPVRPPAKFSAFFQVLQIWGCEPTAQTCKSLLRAP